MGETSRVLLFWLPTLCFANDVSVLVNDITVIINLAANKLLHLTFDDATNNLIVGICYQAVFGDCG